MNLLKLIKREILITVLSIIIIVSFFGALTYAYFMDVKETDLNVINYGDVELTFCADATCGSTIENIGRVIGRDENNDPLFMYPMSQTEALNTVPYIFKLENTGNLKLDLTIKLDKELNPTLDPNHSSYTAVSDSYVYTAIEEQATSPSIKLYTELEEGNILMHISLNPAETKVFNLWTWLKEDVPNEVQGTYFIADISVKGDYKVKMNLKNKVLADNTALSDASINFNTTTGDGLYYTEDSATYGEDGEKIYYFRGRVENNWVSFGGFLWRIVRTTSEGGLKLVYSGDGSTTSSAYINTSNMFNENANSKYYVGYTYNTDLSGYTGAQTDSTIKTIIDTWYTSNLSSYESNLSSTAIYCNDRSSERVDGSNIYYPPYDRKMNYRPTYVCSSTNESRYTVSTETGNGYLSNPIALLADDEINYAGVIVSPSSLNSYITDNATSTHWSTMSPSYFNGTNANGSLVSSTGNLTSNDVYFFYAVRPAVSLKSSVMCTGGNGSKSNPYTIE